MYKRDSDDLWFHDDEELSDILGSAIQERQTIHQWPLSNVERIATEDGRRFVYKTQFGPSVEPEVYAAAKSCVLPNVKTIFRSDLHSCMLLEYIDAPRLKDMALEPDDALRVIHEVIEEIPRIEGEVPYSLDISTADKWIILMESTLQDIRELIAEGKYQQTSLETVKMLEGLASSPEIMDVFDGNIGILHGDLNAGNVFRLPSGYKIIDWQGPVFGPKDLDALKLSRDLHLDPIKHFSKGIVGIDMFLCIHWVTQCRKRWIPWGPWYDGIAAEKAKQMGDLLS